MKGNLWGKRAALSITNPLKDIIVNGQGCFAMSGSGSIYQAAGLNQDGLNNACEQALACIERKTKDNTLTLQQAQSRLREIIGNTTASQEIKDRANQLKDEISQTGSSGLFTIHE